MNEFIVHPALVPPAFDTQVRSVFGFGLDQLILKINENLGGEFNSVFIDSEISNIKAIDDSPLQSNQLFCNKIVGL